MTMKWRPIETAPKNGQEILVCNMKQGGVMHLVYWAQGYWQNKGSARVCLQNTHWMPLPDKPDKQY